jgi:hypothetical protein
VSAFAIGLSLDADQRLSGRLGVHLRGEEPMIERAANDACAQQEFYRGYRIDLFGQGSDWSFKVSQTRFDLPGVGPRYIFFKTAHSKPCALTLAKIEIDRLLETEGRKE